jgi:hypothetical protein
MHNQPPIQLKLGASTGSKAVATWDWSFTFKCWIQLYLHSTYMPSQWTQTYLYLYLNIY